MTDKQIEEALYIARACEIAEGVDCYDVLRCIRRLRSENASLRNEADDNAALAMAQKLRADKLERRLHSSGAQIREETAREIYKLMTGEFEPYIDVGIAKEITDRIMAGTVEETDDFAAYRAALESV